MIDTLRTDLSQLSCAHMEDQEWGAAGWDHARQLERELAEATKERDEWKEHYERLNESLAKNKRLFSSALAERVIDEQAQRIRQLENLYSEMQKEYHKLKSKCTQ